MLRNNPEERRSHLLRDGNPEIARVFRERLRSEERVTAFLGSRATNRPKRMSHTPQEAWTFGDTAEITTISRLYGFHLLREADYFKGAFSINQNNLQEETESKLKSGNFRNFCLTDRNPKNMKTDIHKTIILSVVLYGCKTWLLTLWRNVGWGGSENRLLRRIFGPKRDDVAKSGGNYILRSLMICTPY